mmetsp:Transcript_49116/g.158086  ORF Transcript_49116/g.158086 Transcript_49116/m.158086 type:complete len:207 (+) Transcript_49116:69-689(+)
MLPFVPPLVLPHGDPRTSDGHEQWLLHHHRRTRWRAWTWRPARARPSQSPSLRPKVAEQVMRTRTRWLARTSRGSFGCWTGTVALRLLTSERGSCPASSARRSRTGDCHRTAESHKASGRLTTVCASTSRRQASRRLEAPSSEHSSCSRTTERTRRRSLIAAILGPSSSRTQMTKIQGAPIASWRRPTTNRITPRKRPASRPLGAR